MRLLTSADAHLVAPQTLARIGQHSVGFVKVIGDEDDAQIAGTGTLVTVGKNYAILTADHVLDAMAGNVWLVICREGWSGIHRVKLDVKGIEKITVGKASYDAEGPDLGLIKLARPEVDLLAAKQTFYNLDKRRERSLLDEPLSEYGWGLFGMVHERTIDADTTGTGYTRVKGFFGQVGLGVKPLQRTRDRFDYLDFVALYNEKYDGPQSYQGTSGGGLWQIEYREREGVIEVSEALLSGVAYFESPLVGQERKIHCHGRRSIYELAYDALR